MVAVKDVVMEPTMKTLSDDLVCPCFKGPVFTLAIVSVQMWATLLLCFGAVLQAGGADACLAFPYSQAERQESCSAQSQLELLFREFQVSLGYRKTEGMGPFY